MAQDRGSGTFDVRMRDLPLRGRPPKTEDERLSETLRVRLRPDDKRKLDAHAARLGKSPSDWARETLLRSLNKHKA